MRILIAAYLALSPLLVPMMPAPQNGGAPGAWSRFRGPNGSGVADGASLPDRIGPERNVLWKVDVPDGYSSPVLAGDRVFLTAFEDDRLFTLALDADSGAELWRREAPRARVEQLDSRNNPAAPSPAVDPEGRVYVFFAEFGLLAYDLDGNELWRMPLGPFDNLYGMGASPVVWDGQVLLVCDQRTGSFLISVDGASGEVAWRVERPEAASSHVTPVVWQPPDGEPQLLVVGSFLFSGYSIATGERLWWVRGMIHEMKSVPVIADGVAWVNGYGSPLNDPGNTMDVGSFQEALQYDVDGDGLLSREELPEGSRARRRVGMSDLDRDGLLDERDWEYFRNSMAMTNGMFAIRLGGSGDMTAENFLWLYSRAVPQLPSPLLYEGYLYMVNDGGIVTILDPDSGERLDQGRLIEAVDSYYASPVAGDGKIYMVSELGMLSVLDPGPEITVVHSADLDDSVYATPAIDAERGRIYLRTGTSLYCFAG